MRRFTVLFAVVAVLVGSALPAGAQEGLPLGKGKSVQRSEYNSYVVIMQADPLVVTEGDRLDTNRAKARARELRQSHERALRAADVSINRLVNDYVVALNGFSARLNFRQALRVAGSPGVALVLPDELLQPLTDSSGDFIGLTGPGQAYDAGITGAGVVVGVIDTGIWPEHPSFADNGLPAPPTGPLPCEFGNTAHNPNDAPFTCNNKLIGAYQKLATYRAVIGAASDEFDSARDDNGHGTHTASTAAGNAGVSASILGGSVGDGTISGMAPDAHVIAYKACGNLGCFSSDLASAINQAVADGVGVINYSIGGGGGVLGADDIAFLFAADAGVFVATSAGNSGPGGGTIGSPADNPWLTAVGANTQSRFLTGTVELGNEAAYVGASVTDGVGPAPLVDAADLGNEFCQVGIGFPADSVTGKIVVCKRGVNARVHKSLAVMNGGGVGVIHYEASDQGNLFSDTHFLPTVHIDFTPGMEIKAYIAGNPGTAAAEIRDTRSNSTWPTAPSMTQFSSRGPSSYPDVIKPDITAPGIQILAGYSPFNDPGFGGGELFAAIAGTSMSSPHIAGVFALLKQANPGWSPAAARSALMTTARQDVVDNDRSTPANPFEMGAGHVNPGRVDRHGSAFRPGLVYDAGFLDYLGWLCGTNPQVFANPAATCASLESIGIPTDPSDLNYPSIAVAELAGSQTVTRTVTSVAPGRRTFTVDVDAPDGFDVTVSPSTITLRQGQSATFEVTIVNESAPIGEWRFGSLTWHHGTGRGAGLVSFNVRSPIAVRASEFDAPAQVDGTGVSGSGSFDVKFGYTGEYDATAHGLVAATVTNDTVDQDPNQTFSPSDVGNGATLHTFNLSNTAVFRIAIPPDAVADPNVDLDVFVFDPTDTLVASSTAGATDELIVIQDPADGEWDVYVHGWATNGDDEPYALYTWAIPSAADAGSLVIDSEPADAEIGETGTIGFSWTGATGGEWHFGAISHVGPSGVMGRTLVNIDNR